MPILFLNILFFVGLLVTNLYYKKWNAYRFKNKIAICFYGFWFFFGALVCLLHKDSIQKHYYGDHFTGFIKAYINNEPQLRNGILKFEIVLTHNLIEQQAKPVRGKMQLATKLDDTVQKIELNYGDELLLFLKKEPVSAPFNPAEFDIKAWLASKNIDHQSFILKENIIKIGHHGGSKIIKYAISLRQQQVAIYRKLIKDNSAFAVASTLILGYRADLSEETLNAYSQTGTIHALSVSGMHVGIIYLFLNWALSFLNSKKLLKVLKLVLITSLIWYYALLTGLSPSVLRSAIMLSIYIFAKALNRSSNNYNIWAFTAFCMLAYDPFLIWDVGFQLSFLAVLGLIYLQPKIYKWLYIKNRWLDKLWATVAISLAAQIATFPLSIYYFHQFPIYFIFSNLFILLPLTLMMYLGIAILLLKLYFLAPGFEWIILFTNNGLKWIADLPFSGIRGIWLSQWQLILLSFVLGMLVLALTKYHKKLLFAALSGWLILQGSISYHQLVSISQRKIIFFSLQKNYAAAFINGNEAILVTDLTAKDKSFNFSIKPALDQWRINKIHFIKWEQDSTLSVFNKKGQQLSFHDYRILLVDKRLNHQTITNLPHYQTLWLHQNPGKTIETLRKEVIFKTIVIDASNKDHNMEQYKHEANKINATCYVLKKNNSYLIDLKK